MSLARFSTQRSASPWFFVRGPIQVRAMHQGPRTKDGAYPETKAALAQVPVGD
jgi:hypothetical protein